MKYTELNKTLSKIATKYLKVGDIIECIDSTLEHSISPRLREGKSYFVLRNTNNGIDILDPITGFAYYEVFAHRFKKV